MRYNTKFLLSIGSAGLLLSSCTQKDNKPNVVLILADDMGYSDINCYGSFINTPNIDSIADQGIKYTQFYNAARSCPTRASLLTGLYPHQTGVGDMVHSHGYPSYQGYLNDECVTMAEVLKQAGYNTYMSGKWHVGDEPQNWPHKRGFDKYFGLINGASSYFSNEAYRKGREDMKIVLNDSLYEIRDEDFYMTDAFSDYAVKYIEENKKKPFFLYLAYTAPHWPLHALPEDIKKYEGKYMIGWDSLRKRRLEKMKKLGIVGLDTKLSKRDSRVSCMG